MVRMESPVDAEVPQQFVRLSISLAALAAGEWSVAEVV
jgi:hypothetical protein